MSVSRNYYRVVRFNHLSRSVARESTIYCNYLAEISRLERYRDQLQAKRAFVSGVRLFSVESEILFTQQGHRRLTSCVEHKIEVIKDLKRTGNVEALQRQQNKLKYLRLQLSREKKHIQYLNVKKGTLKERLQELSNAVANTMKLICKRTLQTEMIQANIDNMREEKLEIMEDIAPMENPCYGH